MASSSTNSWTLEITTPVAALRLLRAAVMETDPPWPPNARLPGTVVASAHIVQSDARVGSVKQFNFTSHNAPAIRLLTLRPTLIFSPIKQPARNPIPRYL
jgi:hypothetical protein